MSVSWNVAFSGYRNASSEVVNTATQEVGRYEPKAWITETVVAVRRVDARVLTAAVVDQTFVYYDRYNDAYRPILQGAPIKNGP